MGGGIARVVPLFLAALLLIGGALGDLYGGSGKERNTNSENLCGARVYLRRKTANSRMTRRPQMRLGAA